MFEYKGYIGHIEIDEDAELIHGEVINTRDVITFQGQSIDEIRVAFQESVDDYLEFCRERGEEPEKPYSGNLSKSEYYLADSPLPITSFWHIGVHL